MIKTYWFPKIKGKRRYLLLLLSGLVTALLVWWKTQSPSANPDNGQPHWLPVQPEVLENRLGLVGRIQALRQETLNAPFEGNIREVRVYDGQRVKQGQILASLGLEQIEIQQRQAQAELLKAQREAQQLRNWQQSAEVSRARRAVQTAHTQLSSTQANLRDTRALFERGIVARMEVDTLIQQQRTQQQDLLAAQEELRVVAARGEGENRKIAEMELTNAQARHQAIVEQIAKQTIKAPFAGLVIHPFTPEGSKAIVIQPGVQVTQNTPLFTLIDLHRIQIVSRVEESDLQQLQEGMLVHITGEGFAGQVLTGRMAAIAAQSNSQDTQSMGAYYDVKVSVDMPLSESQGIRLGMSANLSVVTYRNPRGIAVPAEALQMDASGNHYVYWRPAPGTPEQKLNVKPGRTVAQGIEVQGLKAGQVLVNKQAGKPP